MTPSVAFVDNETIANRRSRSYKERKAVYEAVTG